MIKLTLLLALFTSMLWACAANQATSTVTVGVETSEPGESAEAMEVDVTAPIENAVAALPKVISVRSVSSQERSYIEVCFAGTSRDAAHRLVQDALKEPRARHKAKTGPPKIYLQNRPRLGPCESAPPQPVPAAQGANAS